MPHLKAKPGETRILSMLLYGVQIGMCRAFFVKILTADIVKTSNTRAYDFQYGYIRKRKWEGLSVANYHPMAG